VVSAAAGWRGRSVLLTGHTGFKGGWLALWLHRLGANVHGYALEPPTTPGFFEAARVSGALASDTRADVADVSRLGRTFAAARPEVVFHLAAQPLVRESYRDPLATMRTNILGSANVLDAARAAKDVRAIVVITTDKVYENVERPDHAYREDEPLGGHDPYSASKAAAEIVTASYRASFFGVDGAALVATARAGNVIGGGDWSADRLVPDCLRAFERDEPVVLRYPAAVRPWQHVLDPLSGYLRLAEGLLGDHGRTFAAAWNFGPDASEDADVGRVAELTAKLWGGRARVDRAPSASNPHEAGYLRLDSSKARREMPWRPKWGLEASLTKTVEWHRAWLKREDMTALSLAQIAAHEASS
jgi:CDP-glucose 4,6-dehydratase